MPEGYEFLRRIDAARRDELERGPVGRFRDDADVAARLEPVHSRSVNASVPVNFNDAAVRPP